MTEEMKQKRDELAKLYGTDRFPIQNIGTIKDFTQDINFARRMTHTEAFQVGFTACYKLMEAENAELKRKVLSFRQSMSASAQKSREVWTREEELSIENSTLKSRIAKLRERQRRVDSVVAMLCGAMRRDQLYSEFVDKEDEGEG